MYEVTRWFEIDVGHRVMKHESKCRHLHGHRYRIGVTLQKTTLDHVGRVMDFGEMQEVFGSWLLENWDHGLVLESGDPLTEILPESDPSGFNHKMYLLQGPATAEVMAQTFYSFCWGVAGDCVKEVTIYETPNCVARYPSGGHPGMGLRLPTEAPVHHGPDSGV